MMWSALPCAKLLGVLLNCCRHSSNGLDETLWLWPLTIMASIRTVVQ
jgi:hypothetical protein